MSAQDFDEWVLGKRHKFGLELDADKQRLQHELDSTLRQRRSAASPIRLVPPSLPRAVSSACAECVGLVGLQAKVYDGDVYDGEWKNDKREGHGVMRFSNGDQYEGGWKRGKRHGSGVFTWANGNVCGQ